MKISYKKLWVLLAEKEISKVDLRKELGLAPGTMTKLNHNEEVSMSITWCASTPTTSCCWISPC